MTISGTSARIGFLWPADGLNDEEYLRFVPDGVSWLTARYDAGTDTEDLTREVLSAYADPVVLRRGARLLRAVHPDAVACGDHAASFIAGKAGEDAMIRAMEDTLGCPAVTMGRAIVEALGAVGARRIALASPYSEEVTAALRSYLAEAGFDVVDCLVAGSALELDIGTRPPKAWLADLVAFAGRIGERPDALLLAGGGVRFAAAITEFEARTGVTVVTGPGALVRAALHRLGLSHERPGLGRVFRKQAARAAPTIAAHQSTGTKSFAVSDAPPVFVAGTGAWLVSEDGRRYLDFACGSGTTALGHGHPDVLAALARQAESGVLHLGPHFHAPAQAALYERLSDLLPPHLARLHPAVSGAEATEVAIKAAMHATGARRFIGFEGGYHGRTFGALAVSGARGKNEALGPFAPSADILPFPEDEAAGLAAAERIRGAGARLAGIIVEPVQATAGLRLADPDGLAAIAMAAAETGVPLIVDEVFTGFGRTGRLFAFEHFGLVPDMVIFGKSLGGGLPAGLVAGREGLLARWPAGVQTSTFQLHPASAATSGAFLEVLRRDDLEGRVTRLAPVFRTAFEPLTAFPDVRELRGLGAFWALAMTSGEATLRARRRALDRGLLTWECGLEGDVIGLVPPLTIGEAEIRDAAAMLAAALSPE
jgi:4-aminobutyrate aminotransferase-like enzyme